MDGFIMKLATVLILILSVILGVGITLFSSSLVPWLTQQNKIIAAIVISAFAFIALYFMSKSRGG